MTIIYSFFFSLLAVPESFGYKLKKYGSKFIQLATRLDCVARQQFHCFPKMMMVWFDHTLVKGKGLKWLAEEISILKSLILCGGDVRTYATFLLAYNSNSVNRSQTKCFQQVNPSELQPLYENLEITLIFII